MKISNRLVVVIMALAVITAVGLGYQFFFKQVLSDLKNGDPSLNEILPQTYQLPSTDSCLFIDDSLSHIKVAEIWNLKFRDPISFLLYRKTLLILLYKISIANDFTLQNSIIVTNEDADVLNGVAYVPINEGVNLRYKFRIGPITTPVEKIFMTLSTDSTELVMKTDTSIYYHALLNNFSLRYSLNEPIDIFIEGQKELMLKRKRIPADIFIVRKTKNLYFAIMVSNNSDHQVPVGILSQLIKH